MNPSDMTTLTNTLEVFDTYKHREDKDSDEESFHLPLDDDESEQKIQDPVRNGNCKDSEEEILNKFENNASNEENIDSQLEDKLFDKEEEDKKDSKESNSTSGKKSDLSEVVNGYHTEEDVKDVILKTNDSNTTEKASHNSEEDKNKRLTNGFPEKSESENKEVINSEVCKKSNDNKVPIKKSSAATSGANIEQNEGSATDSNSIVQSESKLIEEQKKDKNSVKCQVNGEIKSQENQTSDEKLEEKTDSTDFTKHNEDSEDLFDISIIRDAEEDNAESAFNDTNSEENQTEENEDDDDKVEDDGGNDKIRSEEEEEEHMEVDKNEENLKNDDVDIEESNLNIDSDIVKDGGSDGESEKCNKTDLVDVISEQKTIDEIKSVKDNSVHCRLDEVTGKLINFEDEDAILEEEKKISETSCKEDLSKGSLKRSLSEGESVDVATKKTRTEEVAVKTEIKDEKLKEKVALKSLSCLSEFMKLRNTRRLTMHDLEEFCLQKICEVIVHKSELGDVHHQLKLQEQLIETMRKEIQQLTKQARDLEIVNKKLLNDLKQQTTTQKPLNPLKITRSVGLQVKFTPTFETSAKRRLSTNATLVTAKPPQTTVNRGSRLVANTTATTVVNRQITSPQKQVLTKPQTPLLSQALQNRRANTTDAANKTPNQQTRPKLPEIKNGVPTSPSVIDLTDEDDKKDKNKNATTKIASTKSITVPLRTTPLRVNATTPGIRLSTTQGKVCPITSVVTSSTPQVMYVVQSSSQNALASTLGPKAVVVNFQSTNGVLTSTLNGSAVSVIPNKQNNTIQLKQVGASKNMQNNKIVKVASKHPAPLPPPPMVRVVLDKPLKPIPPKPHLTIRKTDTGIILQWKMPYELDLFEAIASYQLYAYQETSALPSTDMWRKVGDVKALALPMACTLTQFADKNKYYFAVRPVDIHKRIGMFSEPEEISL